MNFLNITFWPYFSSFLDEDTIFMFLQDTDDANMASNKISSSNFYLAQENNILELINKNHIYLCCIAFHCIATSNHRHPNVFCGNRAPQLVISITSIGNQPK